MSMIKFWCPNSHEIRCSGKEEQTEICVHFLIPQQKLPALSLVTEIRWQDNFVQGLSGYVWGKTTLPRQDVY